ncbi:MAG: hypothetical protein D6736_10290, partial [Nitrospinota bacterium]
MSTPTRPLTFFIIVLCGAWLLALPTWAQEGEGSIERVIVISIDGIRNSDGFGDPNCQGLGDVNNCLLKNLAEYVLPEGTLYTSEPGTKGSAFVNNAATWTTPGHEMLLTGVRAVGPNIGTSLDLRPFRPTIFERLRKELNWSSEEVVAVVSKPNVTQIDYSLDPIHGKDYGATLYFVPSGDWAVEDVGVATWGRCLMRGFLPDNTLEACDPTQVVPLPRFLFLHFGGVDNQGHLDWRFNFYKGAIAQVDEQIFTKIWSELCDKPDADTCADQGQNPHFRRNNTALFVTTDHGRESFTVLKHGGLDWANRAIFLLAAGPGIPRGQVITNVPQGNV